MLLKVRDLLPFLLPPAKVSAGVWSVAADFCSSVNDGDYETETKDEATSTVDSETSSTGSMVLVTKTGKSGSAVTSIIYVPHQTGSSGGSSGSSDGASGKSKSLGLSKGAIAGIAIGAAGGAIILCAILFLIYRCVRKRPTYAAVAPTDAQAPARLNTVSIAPVSGKPKLDGKASAITSTIPASPVTLDTPGVSPHPSAISNASPQSLPAMPVAPTSQAPVYPPGMSELQAGAWHYGGSHQPSHTPPPGYGNPIPSPQPHAMHYEMPGPRPPELMGNTQLPQEMHGYSYNGGVYEMPGNRST